MMFEENENMNPESRDNGSILRFEAPKNESSIIKVLGVGGAGTNAVNHMYNEGIQGVDFIVCNTDLATLEDSPVPNKIFLGSDGLGAGNRPEVASAIAEAQKEEIQEVLSVKTKMLFVTAGMGGGTGTGAAPVIARIAKEITLDSDVDKILIIGIVTLPFSFEGRKRIQQAHEGIEKLRKHVDSILIINNDKLRELYGNMGCRQAFAKADNILLTAAKSIAEIITVKAYVNVDFRDVNTVMQNSGVALMGYGIGSGDDRAMEAIRMATSSPLLNDNDIKGATDVLLYMLSPKAEDLELRMDEQGDIADYINELTGLDTNIIWGLGYHDNEGSDRIELTFIATGFTAKEIQKPMMRHETIARPTPEILVEPQLISRTTEEKQDTACQQQSEVKKTILYLDDDSSATEQKEPIEHSTQTESPIMDIPRNDIHVVDHKNAIKSDYTEASVLQETETKKMEPVSTATLWDDSAVDFTDEQTRMRAERIKLIREMMMSPGGLDQLEKVPAYERMGSSLHESTHSSISEASRISISHLDDDQPIRFSENSFLNNNPD